MEKINIKDLEESVYYEKLPNGLEVYLYPKQDVASSYVTFTTKYGSIYNEFVPINEKKVKAFPKGIAHFLEHKVFVQKEGPQPMEYFARSGSICNAYTTFKNTTYLFYATDSLIENINYLLDYVQDLYLTDESVESEKGIITEEIHMYEDSPSDILMEKIRHNTIVNNFYKDSIIGTTSDIESITKEDLETCYNTFYHPSNMFLVAAGPFEPETIINTIRENQSQKNYQKLPPIEIEEEEEPNTVAKVKEIIKVPTNTPKVAYTIKIPIKKIKLTRRVLHLYLYILFTSLFDETSFFDETLKKEGIITNTTYISLLNIGSHILISFINETEKYDEFLKQLQERISHLEITEEDFNRKKKVLISNEIFAYESVENVNDIIMDSLIYDGKFEDNPLEIIENLSFTELETLISKIDIKNNTTVILKNDISKEENTDTAKEKKDCKSHK